MKTINIITAIVVGLALSNTAFATSSHKHHKHGSKTTNNIKQDHTCQGGHNCNTTNSNNTVNNVDNSIKNNAKGGNASQGQGQEQGQSQSATTGDNSVTVSDNSVQHAQARNPVNTAWAAPLVASNDTCMGSTSAGGQGITFGLSFATTWKDEDCVVRKDARFLQNAQRPDVALSLMCGKESVKAAVARAGTRAEKIACGIEVDTPVVATPVVIPTPVVPVRIEMTGERG